MPNPSTTPRRPFDLYPEGALHFVVKMTSTGSALDIVFRGHDGNECETFIAAIEELAFTEGWSEDQKRMLLFARSRPRQGALRWFATLDPSKKKDWDLFVEALFERYPPVQAPAEAEISTPVWSATTFSPSASTAILPPLQDLDSQRSLQGERQTTGSETRHSVLPHCKAYDPSIPGRQLGVLRIAVEDGTTVQQYVWRGPPSGESRFSSYAGLQTTILRHEALVVCFIASREPHPIGCQNITYYFKDLSLDYSPSGATAYNFRASSGVVAIDPNNRYQTYHASTVWNVLLDGSLQASLSVFDGDNNYAREDFKTTEVLLDTSNISISFVKPGTLLRQDDPKRNTQPGRYEFKARIVFEPL